MLCIDRRTGGFFLPTTTGDHVIHCAASCNSIATSPYRLNDDPERMLLRAISDALDRLWPFLAPVRAPRRCGAALATIGRNQQQLLRCM